MVMLGASTWRARHWQAGYLYEITGTDWGQSIAAGQTIQVGFNALTGITENVNIPLTEAMLVADGGAMTVI